MTSRVAALAVGINDYPPGFYLPDERPLKCAARSAGLFATYVRRCWPDPKMRRSVFLTNARATRAAIMEGATALGQRRPENKPYDLFIVYLAGHGRARSNGGWFCSHSADRDEPDLDSETMADILALVPADRTLLLLDCCHSAAVVADCAFFRSLPGATSVRTFLASSRADQLSWEHDGLSRTIFAHSLFDLALAPASGGDAREWRSFDVDVFPLVNAQVSSLAADLKGAVQEPVRGGVQSEDLKLPVHATGHVTPRNIAMLIWRRRWQVSLTAACIILAGVILIQSTMYHLAPTSRGYIGVWAGISELSFTLPGESGLRAETPFKPADLFPDETIRKDFADGSKWGLWLPDDGASREWGKALSNSLDLNLRDEWAVFQGVKYLTSDQLAGEGDRPVLSDRIFAEGILLGANVDIRLQKFDAWRSQATNFEGCSASPQKADDFLRDISILYDRYTPSNLMSSAHESADIGSMLALSGDRKQFELVRTLIWMASTSFVPDVGIKSKPLPVDATTLGIDAARVLAAISAAAGGPDSGTLQTRQLQVLSSTRCAAIADFVASVGVGGADAPAVAARQIKIAESISRSSEPLVGDQAWALRGLSVLGQRGLLPERMYFTVRSRLAARSDGNARWAAWLVSISRKARVPAALTNDLLQDLERRAATVSPAEDPVLNLLLQSASYLPPGQLTRLQAAFEQIRKAEAARQEDKPPSTPTERQRASANYRAIQNGLGWLGAAGRLPADVLERFAMGSPSMSASDQAPVALGRIAQTRKLTDGLDVLYAFSKAFPESACVREVFRGIANQRRLSRRSGSLGAAIVASLAKEVTNTPNRIFEIAVSVEEIRLTNSRDRKVVLESLHDAWVKTKEPVTKFALAQVILRARRAATDGLQFDMLQAPPAGSYCSA